MAKKLKAPTKEALIPATQEPQHPHRVRVLANSVTYSEGWEPDHAYQRANPSNPMAVHTIDELVECLEQNKDIKLEARVLATNKTRGERGYAKLNARQFCEHAKNVSTERTQKLRESVDYFAQGDADGWSSSIVGGPDFVPLMGGPFYKQLYYFDYIRMHSAAFYAYNHDPMAKAIVQTMRDFTMSREWKLEFKSQEQQAVWDAFVEVNNLYSRMDQLALEMSIYGETFIWWLPNNETKIAYRVQPGQQPAKGLLPRIRLVDPSCFWEIVTFPEDIERVLYYQWVAPTQYQTYSGNEAGKTVGISKFIVQQIPADQIQHYKVNSVSNEKRGRSDLFPVLGFLKRLRDTVDYSIIAMQKAAAWCIDTEVQGSQQDLDDYVASQQQIGPIAPAGSEFVHSDKVKREYLSHASNSSKGGASAAFDWCLSMIAAGSRIPLQYLGTHLSGAQTRASAIVATEPVAKLFEGRQNVYKRVLTEMANKLFKELKLSKPEFRCIFPELVVQDRSQKLKDLAVAEDAGWLSRKRAAEIAAKELGIQDYNWETEQAAISQDSFRPLEPLTAPGIAPDAAPPEAEGITGQQRRSLDQSRGM